MFTYEGTLLARHKPSSSLVRFALIGLVLLLQLAAPSTVYFEESFNNGPADLDRWVAPSKHESKDETPLGNFTVSYRKYRPNSDYGLKTSEDYRFYCLSRKFDSTASNKDKDLVIQFSIAHEQDIDCGGGYVKLYDSSVDQKTLTKDTPYKIMFGPDICGPSKKIVQVILNHKNENYECLSSIRCKDNVFTHVYTLVMYPNQTFAVKIDNEVTKTGNLTDEWSMLPPRKIKDPKAVKPESWDDRREIDDPEDTKPEDWDQPELVVDESATQPDDWKEEEDGKWEAPMKPNEAFKGEWKPKTMKNPNYSGVWVAPLIDNPDFVPDDTAGIYTDIGVIGIDVWQVKAGSIFDDFLVTDDEQLAHKRAQAIISAVAEEEKNRDIENEKAMPADAKVKDDDEDEDHVTDDDDEMDDTEMMKTGDAVKDHPLDDSEESSDETEKPPKRMPQHEEL